MKNNLKLIGSLIIGFGVPIFGSIWSMSIGNWKSGIFLFLFITLQFILLIDDTVKTDIEQKSQKI